MKVYFEETGEEREIVRVCARCAKSRQWNNKLTERDCTIVSPSGTGHLSNDTGEETACGIDATYGGWWHKL